MTFPVEADAGVIKRLGRRPPPGVKEAFDAAVDRLARDPFEIVPDKHRVWRRVYPNLANHRHMDLPHAWRMAYTVASAPGRGPVVVILWIGTHKEYEVKCGFKTR